MKQRGIYAKITLSSQTVYCGLWRTTYLDKSLSSVDIRKRVTVQKILFFFLHPLWRLYDALVPKRDNYWAFATHHIHTGRFIENQRALFERIKCEQGIRKIIFYRGEPSDFQLEDAFNYEIVKHGSWRGYWLLAQCRVVFLTHSIAMDFSLRWGGRAFSVLKLDQSNRTIVNLWHGIPIKRLLYTANEQARLHTDRVSYRRFERARYAGLVASSDIDSYAMAAMFYPLNYGQVWLTGLPRNDFLLMPEEQLPRYIRESIQSIRRLKNGKRLVLYAPTYRQTNVSTGAYYYQFSPEEIDSLRDLLGRHNAVLGYRPHYFKNSKEYFNLDQFIDGETIIDLSQAVVPELSAAARECEVLLTDYSSVHTDTLYLDKPSLCFAYDLDEYLANQDGLLYDLSLVFGHGICGDYQSLLGKLDLVLSGRLSSEELSGKVARKIFFNYRDGLNSQRVYERVCQALGWQ